jgi:hypothetical protein
MLCFCHKANNFLIERDSEVLFIFKTRQNDKQKSPESREVVFRRKKTVLKQWTWVASSKHQNVKQIQSLEMQTKFEMEQEIHHRIHLQHCTTFVTLFWFWNLQASAAYHIWIGHLLNHISPQTLTFEKTKKNGSKHTLYFTLDLFFPNNNWKISISLIQF